MRKPSTELFNLVKAMTKSEKRYFKLFAARHMTADKLNYLRLFDQLDKLEEYDEQVLKRKIEKEHFVEYLPSAKYYLYNIILESLHAFHEEGSIDSRIKKAIHQAEILYDKGLIEQSRKLLKTTRLQAYANDRFQHVLDILALEKKLIARTYYTGFSPSDIQAIHEEEEQCILRLQNANEFWRLHGQIYQRHFSKGQLRNKRDAAELEELIAHPLLSAPEKALSFKAQLDYYQIHAIYQFLKGRTDLAYEYNRSFLNLMEENVGRIKEFPKRYMASLNNYLIDSLRLNKLQEFEEGLLKFRQLPTIPAFDRIENLEVDIFRLSYILELNMLVDRGDFVRANDLLPEVKRGIETYADRIVKHNRITLFYLAAYISFGAEQYSQAAWWVNQIINDTSEDMVEDIYAFARVLQLFIHYEMGNYDLIEYLMKSAQRYLNKRDRLYQVESHVLRFMRKCTTSKSKNEINTLLHELLDAILPLKEDAAEQRAFGYFDFISWIESHLHGSRFAAIVQAKNKLPEPEVAASKSI